MYSILRLFDQEFAENLLESRSKSMFDNCVIPKLNYPKPGSKEFEDDIESVIHYFNNSSLGDNFLKGSDDSVQKCFKTFCTEYELYVDWKDLKKAINAAESVVSRLKKENNRPRPKTFLCDQSDYYNVIKDSNSSSFPSGHTTIAYFISEILSALHPESRVDITILADLIGHSRLENGKHFPTDITAGKFLGQILAEYYLQDQNPPQYRLRKKDYRNFAKHLIKNSKDINRSVASLADFIKRTNQIEGYDVEFKSCLEASEKLHQGFPEDYITDHPHIINVLKPLVFSHAVGGIDTISKLITSHSLFKPQCLENSRPGEIRNYLHFSPTGHEYTSSEKIYEELNQFFVTPYRSVFEKHAAFEHIHPFSDGNGRIGRTILCADCSYDFERVNKLIGVDYINKINNYFSMI